MPSRRPAFLPNIGMAVASTISFSFHLGYHRSAVSLSDLNVSPLTQTTAPLMGSEPSFNYPTHMRVGPVVLTFVSPPTPPPSSFILLSFAWFYILFSTGQVLLSALSWCSACTSVSEGVVLMYLWRDMYSTSTFLSTLLFSLFYCF